MSGLRCLAVLLLAVVAMEGVHAATFSVICNGEPEVASSGCTVKLTGPIEPGDAYRLRQTLKQPTPVGFNHRVLLLDSPGGSVTEAIELARVVRDALLQTSTLRLVRLGKGTPPRYSYPCISACFLVWIAGTERLAFTGHDPINGYTGIGLHRPYFSPDVYRQSPGKIAEAQQSMTAAVRDYLRREQVPEEIIQKMLERSSKEVYWVSESGDNTALTGRSPWFEEMLISRCAFDPAYDEAGMRRAVTLVSQRKDVERDKQVSAHLEWRQRLNGCVFDIRNEAQVALRR